MSHLYIHIPFCNQRCGYCDFVTSTDLTKIEDYCKALILETELLFKRFMTPLKTLYFGGGTPSLLTPNQFIQIVKKIEATFGLPNEEFTVELNPESITPLLVKTLKDLGVNRISMGMQSSQRHLLKVLNRQSTFKQVYDGINLLQRYGIDNYNVDLIYGIPQQTLENVKDSLMHLLDLRANHVSAYALKVEANTLMAKRLAAGDYSLPDDDAYADFLDCIIDTLQEAGIYRYEISNFARRGKESRHNLAYWHDENTLGLGVASVYKVDNRRYVNTIDFNTYFYRLTNGDLPIEKTEIIVGDEAVYEYLITHLRLVEGVSEIDYFKRFQRHFKDDYDAWIAKYSQYNLLKKEGNRYRLTRRGLNISNYLLAEL